MASEKVLQDAIQSIAQESGFRSGRYNIVLDNEHEYMYMGLQKRYRIVNDDGATMYLLVKLPPTTRGPLIIPTEDRFFNNVHYFCKVQPILKQYGVVPTGPKLYGSSLNKNEEYLILEDLEARGFKRMDPSQGLSKAELALVINTLSTFHLTVRYWKTRNLSEFNNICSQFRSDIGPQNKDKIKMCENLVKKILLACWALSRPTYGTLLRANIEEALKDIGRKIVKSLGDVRDQPWATLVNCQMWSANMLFRYHTVTGGAIDVAFEDWSSARIGSPILDLSFLGFSSSSQNVFPELREMLEQYFTSHLSKAELVKHYPDYGIYGVYWGLVVNVSAAFENDIDLNDFETDMLTNDEMTSEVIPDIRSRVVSIIKSAVDVGIL